MKARVCVALGFLLAILAVPAMAQDAGQMQPPTPPPGSGFLGGKFAPINDDVADELGIEVQDGMVAIEIIEDSPADKAGLKEKDILKKIDGQAIDGPKTFQSILFQTKPGQTIKLGIVRDKQEQELSVTLGERPKNTRPSPPTTRPG